MRGFFLYTLPFPQLPSLILADQVSRLYNTLKEVAASSKDKYVGKRKAREERKEEIFICST